MEWGSRRHDGCIASDNNSDNESESADTGNLKVKLTDSENGTVFTSGDVRFSPGKDSQKPVIECPVCLQQCVHPVELPCSHVFCFLCVKGVANRSKRCALCRQEIPLSFFHNPKLINQEDLVKTAAFEDGYQWFYEGRNGWWQYDERTSADLEEKYKVEEKSFELLIAGFLYVIDLDSMLQYRRNDPTRRRRIKRDLETIPEKKGVAGLRTSSTGTSRQGAYGVETLSSKGASQASSAGDGQPPPHTSPTSLNTPLDSSATPAVSTTGLSSLMGGLHISQTADGQGCSLDSSPNTNDQSQQPSSLTVPNQTQQRRSSSRQDRSRSSSNQSHDLPGRSVSIGGLPAQGPISLSHSNTSQPDSFTRNVSTSSEGRPVRLRAEGCVSQSSGGQPVRRTRSSSSIQTSPSPDFSHGTSNGHVSGRSSESERTKPPNDQKRK